MTFKAGVGKSDFEALRKSNNYNVDKTEFIYEPVEETDNQVSLYTRPRRFGKTLMMSMLANFSVSEKKAEACLKDLGLRRI